MLIFKNGRDGQAISELRRCEALSGSMRKMGQHFGDGEAFGRRFASRIFFGQLGHQTAQNSRGRLQKVQAGSPVKLTRKLARRGGGKTDSGQGWGRDERAKTEDPHEPELESPPRKDSHSIGALSQARLSRRIQLK